MPAPYKATDTVDFVVIGSGAAGGSVAKELSEAGFDVVVLEQGPYLREKDFTHDEVKFGYLRSPLELWTGSWTVPDEAPTSVISYTVTATDRFGRTATFTPFSAEASQLVIVQ